MWGKVEGFGGSAVDLQFLHIHGLGTYVKHALPSILADLPFAPHDQDTEIRQQNMRWNVDLCEFKHNRASMFIGCKLTGANWTRMSGQDSGLRSTGTPNARNSPRTHPNSCTRW